MFYITNTTSHRLPYRVEEIGKDRHNQKQSDQEQDQESEAEKHKKFLKASEKLYKKRSVLLAGTIMNKKILPLKESLSLEEAWTLIKEHRFEHFPIISEEGKLVGLLSEKEILRKIQENQGKKSLKDVIAKSTICADASTNLQEMLQVFFNEPIEAVPIIDQHQKVVGMLSRNDLFYTILKVSTIKPK